MYRLVNRVSFPYPYFSAIKLLCSNKSALKVSRNMFSGLKIGHKRCLGRIIALGETGKYRTIQ